MTDSEIVKAKELIKKLEEAYNAYYDTSKGMPYDIDETLRESAFCLENCLNEINHLQAENEELQTVKKHIDTLIHRGVEYPTAETYEKAFQKALEQLYDNTNAKAEAYKECIEKVKEGKEILFFGDSGNHYRITDRQLDNLLKELVGEDNV